MRTTLTLDPDVARMVDEELHRRRTTMRQVINDALRLGLSPRPRPTANAYTVVPHRSALRPGFDPVGFNRLADQLDDDRLAAQRGGGQR